MTPMTLGAFLLAERHTRQHSLPAMAMFLGLPVDRVQLLEHDADLPSHPELHALAYRLSVVPHRLRRCIEVTCQRLLDDAWTPHLLREQPQAARMVAVPLQRDDLMRQAVLLLPMPLRTALGQALHVVSNEPAALQSAWMALHADPRPTYRHMVFESAIARMRLEGETP